MGWHLAITTNNRDTSTLINIIVLKNWERVYLKQSENDILLPVIGFFGKKKFCNKHCIHIVFLLNICYLSDKIKEKIIFNSAWKAWKIEITRLIQYFLWINYTCIKIVSIKRSKIRYWLYVHIYNVRSSVRLFIAYWRLSQKWDVSWWIINLWREKKLVWDIW